MDGENDGKPYKNGWFGGTPIFGNTHIRSSLTLRRHEPIHPQGAGRKYAGVRRRMSSCRKRGGKITGYFRHVSCNE